MSEGAFDEHTYYRARRLGRTMRAVALGGGALIAAPSWVETSEPLAFRVGCLVAGVAWALHGLLWATREGVHTDGEGVTLRGPLRTRRFAWEEVESFQVSPHHPLDRVEMVTTGGRVRVPGLAQGPMEWEGGETDDAAGRLNAHLAWARAR